MVDIDKTLAKAIAAWPEHEDFLRRYLPKTIREVEAKTPEDIPAGDFYYQACGGVHVQRVNYLDEGLDDTHVFLDVTHHDWEDEEA
jgi:hypothetical protein